MPTAVEYEVINNFQDFFTFSLLKFSVSKFNCLKPSKNILSRRNDFK